MNIRFILTSVPDQTTPTDNLVNIAPADAQAIDSDIPEKQEDTRSTLAKACFVLFAIVIALALYYFIFRQGSSDSTNGLLSVIGTVASILSFVMGFYFGQKQN